MSAVTPLISIITPAWNAAVFLAEAVASIRAQDLDGADWEWIVVDDASTDATPNLLRAWGAADTRIRPVFLARNGGPALARRHAVAAARGRYIAFLDADDLWLPGKLRRQVQFMQAENAAFSYTALRRISMDGARLYPLRRVPARLNWRQLLSNTAIACSTVMLDRERLGLITVPEAPVEDFALWLAILRRGVVAYGLNEDLARYRVLPRSRSSHHLGAAWRVWRTYREVEHLALPLALTCFVGYVKNALWRRVRS